METEATRVDPQTEDTLVQLSRRRRLVALVILSLAMTCAWADRTIIATIGQAIKVDLRLTDAQLGMLHGFAFSLSFLLFALPMAWLAERMSRARLVAGVVVLWSVFTTLSGRAGSFAQLLVCRAGVGIGEAGCGPSAYSLISDYFRAERRASALSIYNVGVPIGTMIGAAMGGVVTQLYGWRAAFYFLGIPGLAVAALVWFFVPEVPRGLSDRLSGRAREVKTPPKLIDVARRILGQSSARHLFAAMILQAFVTHGAGAFNAPFFIRVFHMNYAEAGGIIGLSAGLAGAIGTMIGGFLADHLAARWGKQWYGYICALSFCLACPLYILAYMQSDWRASVALITIGGVVQYGYFSPLYASIYGLVDARMRAAANAFIVVATNLIALLLGSMFIGWIIDTASASAFSASGLGSFAESCPGGVAPITASAAVSHACRAAIGRGTTLGLEIAALGYLWAGIHSWLASRTIARELDAGEPQRDRPD